MADDNGHPKSVSAVAEPEADQPKVKKGRAKKPAKKGRRAAAGARLGATARVPYPKDSLLKSLRIPQAILEQNAGNACTPREAAGFARVGWTGDVGVEISSATKYGLLERPTPGKIKPTELVRKIVRPEGSSEKQEALREAVLTAPVISDLYKRYRGEYLPDKEFIRNTAIHSYSVPEDQVEEFIAIFMDSLKEADLLQDVGDGKTRVLDITHSTGDAPTSVVGEEQLKKLSKGVTVQATDTCFVMMPFAAPTGGYYKLVYEPAIERAKMKPMRADADIYGTGKIIDQIWHGIHNARVLVAELTAEIQTCCMNWGWRMLYRSLWYSSLLTRMTCPFDVQHVRVIYYEKDDPFWGQKLIEKVAENILSALTKPERRDSFQERLIIEHGRDTTPGCGTVAPRRGSVDPVPEYWSDDER